MQLTIVNDDSYSVPSDVHFQLIAGLIDAEIGLLPGAINLVFCDEETIQGLNKQYRDKDKVTDVLSFPYFEEPTTDEDLLGELYICVPQTERQATEEDWPEKILEQHSIMEMELYKLCIHGLLHLRGYDHEKDEDYRVMKLLEDKIMDRFLTSEKS